MKLYGKLLGKKFLLALAPFAIAVLVSSLLATTGILVSGPICEGQHQVPYCEEPIGPDP